MKRFFKSLLLIGVGIFLGFILVVLLAVSIALNFSNKPLVLKENTWLIVNFGGKIVEKPLPEMEIFGKDYSKIHIMDYLQAIRIAADDSKIQGIIINGDFTFYHPAHTNELIAAIEEFKKSGKKVHAWFSNANNSNYALCTAADQIYMPDTKAAYLSLTGYAVQIPYLKKGLNTIGIDFSVIHVGQYKGAGENYSRESMSEALKNSYYRFYDDYYEHFINDISRRRKIAGEKLNRLFVLKQNMFITPDQAIENGLIDAKKSYQALLSDLYIKNSIPVYDYAASIKSKGIKPNKVAVVYADGVIYNYYSTDGSRFNQNIVGAKTFIQDLKKIGKDDSIKAVIIRVNSPGGSALASELMLQAIFELKKIKPVYVSIGPIAASGGYYLSLGGQKIFVNPYSITGSIGVVSILMNYQELIDKLGINYETIKKYEMDDIFSPTRKMTADEIMILKKSMQNIYSEFTNHVIEERKIEPGRIPEVAEGRIWTGSQAIDQQLADEIGGLYQAVLYAVEENKIDNFSVIAYPRGYSFFEKLKHYGSSLKSEKILKSKLSHIPEINQIYQIMEFNKHNGKKPAYFFPFQLQ